MKLVVRYVEINVSTNDDIRNRGFKTPPQVLNTFQIPFYGDFLSLEQENCTKIEELRQHLQFWFTLTGKETFRNMYYTVKNISSIGR